MIYYKLTNKKWGGDYSLKGNDATYTWQIRDVGDNRIHGRIECTEFMAQRILDALNQYGERENSK